MLQILVTCFVCVWLNSFFETRRLNPNNVSINVRTNKHWVCHCLWLIVNHRTICHYYVWFCTQTTPLLPNESIKIHPSLTDIMDVKCLQNITQNPCITHIMSSISVPFEWSRPDGRPIETDVTRRYYKRRPWHSVFLLFCSLCILPI